MSFDMRDYANDLAKTMAKAQTLTTGQRGYDFAAMREPERTGYCKAMLDCIDHLERQAAAEPSEIVAAGLRIAARELSVFRNEKLRAVPQ